MPVLTFARLAAALFLLLAYGLSLAQEPGNSTGGPLLFGYKEQRKDSMEIFPLWLSVQKRYAEETAAQLECEKSSSQCPLSEWYRFLANQRGKSPREQLAAVNAYGNQKKYVLDSDNYGVNDYWATPREFLKNNGDCEDYAIFKYFSLKLLGFNPDSMRIVILQDTNLRIAHAVLAVYTDNNILILDNQAEEIISHRNITHYIPIYTLNEKHWWLHIP